jgi:hypothetical protein
LGLPPPFGGSTAEVDLLTSAALQQGFKLPDRPLDALDFHTHVMQPMGIL